MRGFAHQRQCGAVALGGEFDRRGHKEYTGWQRVCGARAAIQGESAETLLQQSARV